MRGCGSLEWPRGGMYMGSSCMLFSNSSVGEVNFALLLWVREGIERFVKRKNICYGCGGGCSFLAGEVKIWGPKTIFEVEKWIACADKQASEAT